MDKMEAEVKIGILTGKARNEFQWVNGKDAETVMAGIGEVDGEETRGAINSTQNMVYC